MGSYYIRSIIGRIAEGIEYLIRQGTIEKSRKVILYGLDRHAFAMRNYNLTNEQVEMLKADDRIAYQIQAKTGQSENESNVLS